MIDQEKDLTGTKMLTGTATEASGRNLARESGNGGNSASREKHATRDRAKENGIEKDPNVTSPRKGKERGRGKRTNPKMAIEEVAAEIVHHIDGKEENPGIRKIVPLSVSWLGPLRARPSLLAQRQTPNPIALSSPKHPAVENHQTAW